jgi:glycosyltransferase involved in cell wall biosynthesis
MSEEISETASDATSSSSSREDQLRAEFAAEREKLGAQIAKMERQIAWLKRTCVEYWVHAIYRWFRWRILNLPDLVQMKFIKWNKVQIGELRQYDPRPVVYDSLAVTPANGNWLPTFAIATPSFNQANYLPATVASVLGQPGVEVDYFVQDGGSKDGSADWLQTESVRNPRLRWISERDSGQADAINRGLSKVNGEIMAWLNSDDVYAPGALQFVAAYFRDHPEIDVVYGHRLLIDAAGDEIGRWIMPPHNDEALTYFDYIPQETVFWRRSLWEKSGAKLDATFQFALDWELLLRFRNSGARMVRVPYFLACFRVHEEQKTSSQIREVGKPEMLKIRGVADPNDKAYKKLFRKMWFREMRAARMTWLRLQFGQRCETL